MRGHLAGGAKAEPYALGTVFPCPATVAVAAESSWWASSGAKMQEAPQVVGLPTHTAPVSMALSIAAFSGCCRHVGHVGTQGGHEVVPQAGTAFLGRKALVRTCAQQQRPGQLSMMGTGDVAIPYILCHLLLPAASSAAGGHTHS